MDDESRAPEEQGDDNADEQQRPDEPVSETPPAAPDEPASETPPAAPDEPVSETPPAAPDEPAAPPPSEECACPRADSEVVPAAAPEDADPPAEDAPEVADVEPVEEYAPARTEPSQLEVGVTFPHNATVYSFASGELRLSIGDRVLVRTDKGVDLGDVVKIKGRLTPERAEELTRVVRLATDEDTAHVAEQQEREGRAVKICEEKIAEHDLPMKLIGAHLSFDNTRMVFLFSSEGRVDFRELVRDLAKTFKMRIELRQVGVRDEAKLMGGLGPCGRSLCCATFMRNFEPVGIRIAKDQDLALNPAKLSGLCDRLMCCLRFEHQAYLDKRKNLPKKGMRVQGPDVVGQVTKVHVLTEKLSVRVAEGRDVVVLASEVRVLADGEEPEFTAPPQPERAAPPGLRSPSRGRERPRPERKDAEGDEEKKDESGERKPSRKRGGKRRARSRPKKDRQPDGQAAGPKPAGGGEQKKDGSDAKSDGSSQRKPRRRRGGRRRRRSKKPADGGTQGAKS